MGLTPLTKVKNSLLKSSICTKAKKLNDVIAVLNPPFPHLFSVKKLIGDTPGIFCGGSKYSEKNQVPILAKFLRKFWLHLGKLADHQPL
jgi:hypothetical protein